MSTRTGNQQRLNKGEGLLTVFLVIREGHLAYGIGYGLCFLSLTSFYIGQEKVLNRNPNEVKGLRGITIHAETSDSVWIHKDGCLKMSNLMKADK